MNRPSWTEVAPDRIIGPGHPAGDFLRAYEWRVLEERSGYLRLQADIPEHVLNPKQELFGGFTPTYVDLVSILTPRAGPDRLDPAAPRGWMSTLNMRIDYFEPVRVGSVELIGEMEHQRGRTFLVSMRMIQFDTLAVHALTTLRATEAPAPAFRADSP